MNSKITLWQHILEAFKFRHKRFNMSTLFRLRHAILMVSAFSSFTLMAQVPLVSWDVNGVENYGVSPLAPDANPNLENVIGLTRGSGVNAGSGGVSGGWGGTNWESAYNEAVADESVISFGFKPKAGFAVSLLSLEPFSYRRSGTGPQDGRIEYTIDGGSSYSGITQGPFFFGSSSSGGAAVSPSRTLHGDLDLQETSQEIGFRLVPYNSSSASGSFYIYDVASGSDFSINGRILGTTETELSLDACIDSDGTAETFIVKGDGLTPSNVIITAPASFEISVDGSNYAASLSLSPVDGSVSQSYFVRLKNGLAAGEYNEKVTVTGGGFTSAANIGVDVNGTVHALPTAFVNSISSICLGDDFPTVSIDLTGNAPFSLTYSDGTSSTGPVSASATPYEVSSSSNGQVFTATALTDAKGCVALEADLTGSATVVVNSLPEVSVVAASGITSGLAGIYNEGEDISLTASIDVGSGEYSWEGPNSFTAGNDANPIITNSSSDNSGVYTVTLTNENACQATATVNVIVYNSVLYVDDSGDDNNIGDENNPLATIQKAIDVSASGGIINVAAGTYAENLVVNKELDIRGPNYGISPNTGTRVGEAIVVPATSGSDAIFIIEASDISINGFKLDGDNTTLTSGWIGTNGADIDVYEGIAYYDSANSLVVNGLKVENNILQNIQYFGIDLFGWKNYNNPSTTGHLISNNLFNDLGTYNAGNGYDKWGGAILLYNDNYAHVTDNVMNNVRMGVQTGNFHDENPGDAIYQKIENNIIQTRRLGVFFNLHTGPAVAPMTVSNNTISAIPNANEAKWNGMLLSSLSHAMGTVNGNMIDGTGTDLGTTTVNGIEVWNVKNDGTVTISGGTISNVNTGIFLNNFDGYSSNASNGAHASISGVTISPNAAGTGIRLLDSPNSEHAAVEATLGSGIVINGGAIGIKIDSASAKLNSPIGNVAFTGQSGDYITVVANTNDFDATAVSFDGKTGAEATNTVNFAVEDKISHKMDDNSLGFVSVKANNNFVTTSSGTIQQGVNVAAAGYIVNVAEGTYNENVIVDKSVSLFGANADTDCSGTRNPESIISVSSGLPFNITADNVVINGFEITAPASSNAVVIGNVSNASVMFNNIHDIGTSYTGGNIHAVVHIVPSGGNSDITVSDNCINDISSTNLTGYSSSGVGILQSTSTGVLTGLNIERNVINNVTVNDGNWPTGKIAYGVQINVGGNGNYLTTTGNVKDALLNNNEISNISGHIATAIALEGNTEDAIVKGNKVSNLTSTKNTGDVAGGGYDLNGLKFENNRYVETVTVEDNSFETSSFTNGSTANLGYAVVNYVPSTTATLGCNWLGTAVFNEIEDNQPTSGKVLSKSGAAIVFSPYLTSGGDGAGIGFQPTGSCDGGPIVISSAVASPELCESKGAVLVTFSGGQAPFTFSWASTVAAVAGGPSYDITGLDAGTYTITITDNLGASATTTAEVISLPVSNLSTSQGYATIQAAIDDAMAGDVIKVCPATYNERVLIDKSITLQGAGTDSSLQVIDGTGISGSGDGIQIANGVKNVNISNLTVQNFSGANGNVDAGIYAIGGNDGLTISKVAIKDNVGGSGIYANGPIDGVTITNSLVEGHTASARGIVIWNGFKENITITGNTVNNSNCCGIELQDGTASAVNISNNTIDIGIGDNAMGLTSLNELTGPNVIDNNTITGGGRYGIEIKNPAGGVTVSNNTLTLTTQSGNSKDRAGIAIFRRAYLTEQGYANIPNGVTISGNSVTGYQQTNGGSNSDGFGIVVEGTNHIISGNTLTNNDIGIQQQAGHTPYTADAAGDGDDSDVADLYFGRGNSPELCNITLTNNVHSGNSVDERIVIGGGTGTIVTEITPTVDDPVDIEVCEGESISEVVFSGNNLSGVVYDWTNDNTDIGLAGSGSGNIPAFTAENEDTTVLIANITVTPTVNGCSGNPQTFTISVGPKPTLDDISNIDVCNGGTVSGLTFTGTATSFDWVNTNPSIGLAASGTGDIADFTATNTSGIPQTAYLTVIPSFAFGGKTCAEASKTFTIIIQDDSMAEIDCPEDVIIDNETGLCSAVVNFDLPMAFDNIFADGFEAASSETWIPYNSLITKVVSGTDGITSASGSSHGEINTTGDAQTGVFSRIGGYSSEFGNGFRNKLDVYIDLNDPAVSGDTYGWDVSSAANNQDNTHLRDFIFHNASNASGNVLVAASTGSTFAKREDLASINHYEISASGWYTYEWIFKDAGDGSLAVDMSLLDASGTKLFTKISNTPSDVIATEVGGNRYMWFTFIAAEKLRIDNVEKANILPTTSDYVSGSAFPVGTTTVTVSATNECSVATTCTFDITVNDVEAPTFTDCPTDAVICSDEAEYSWNHVKLIDNCVVQGGMTELTYQLSGATTSGVIEVNSFDGSTSGTETFNVGTTTVTYSAKDSSGNVVSNVCSFTVEVKEAAVVEAGDYADICENGTVNLAGSFSGSATSITWTDGGIGGSFAPDANNPEAVYTPPTGYSGTVLLTITSDDPEGPCPAGIDTTSFIVNALPIVEIVEVAPICAGEDLNLTVSDGTTYSWSGPNGFSSELKSPSISEATVDAGGVYSVTVTDANACNSVATMAVIVYPNEAPTVETDNNELCKGESAVLTGTCSSSSDIFRWTTPGISQSNGVSSLSSTGTLTVDKAGTYSGYCETENGCISELTSVVIDEKSNCGGGSFISITPELPSICPGASIDLTATGCTGTLTWYADGTSPVTGSTVTLSPAVTTVYFVSCSSGGSNTVDVRVAEQNLMETGKVTTGMLRVKASETIESTKKIGDANFTPAPNVTYEAGNAIVLMPGFSTEHSTVFKAEIKVCE